MFDTQSPLSNNYDSPCEKMVSEVLVTHSYHVTMSKWHFSQDELTKNTCSSSALQILKIGLTVTIILVKTFYIQLSKNNLCEYIFKVYFFTCAQIAQTAQPMLFKWVMLLEQSWQQCRNTALIQKLLHVQNKNSQKAYFTLHYLTDTLCSTQQCSSDSPH